MIVVPDASALITLARIGRLELLRELAEHVRVPEAVYREESEAGLGRPGSRGICAVRLPVRATAPLRRTWVSGTTRSADSA